MNVFHFAAQSISSIAKATTRCFQAIKTNTPALLKWVWRAWPPIVVLGIFCVHLLLIFSLHLNARIVNATVSFCCQLLGGAFVLYSINRNVDIIMGENFYSIFVNYLREFPLPKRSVALEAQSVATIMGGATLKGIGARHPKSIEEKIEYLQEQIDELRKDLQQESNHRTAQIADLSQKMSAKTQETESALRSIKSKVKKTLGGVTGGVFGVLLVFYGALARFPNEFIPPPSSG